MKKLLHIITVAIIALIATSCTIDDLPTVQPTEWEKREFKESVSRAVRKAVNRPGIDNGTTIVVTSNGDTLIAPTDTTLAASSIRTVYVDIQSPQYPNGLTSKALGVYSVMALVVGIAVMVLLILVGVFIVVIRRQHARNKAIYRAIAEHYDLPESFFTHAPKAAPITVNQTIQTAARTVVSEGPGDEPPSVTVEETIPRIDKKTIESSFKAAGKACSEMPAKELRNGFILCGIGVFSFLAFAAADTPGLGFLVGGALIVFGVARFIPYLFKKF